jgi:hypothetical protein
MNATAPNPAFNGSPPLTFHGGAVTGTSTPGELTVTPVYWLPTGFSEPTNYKNLINQFIADSAADNGKRTNVFSSLTQFTNSANSNLSYKLHAGTPITDTTAFPTNGCAPDTGPIYNDNTGYTKCITNAQLLTEARNFTIGHGLPNQDLAHLYMYFLPKPVETCSTSKDGAQGGTCSINSYGINNTQGAFCGYHTYSSSLLIADMNFAVVDSPLGTTCSSDAGSNTGGNQSPNNNIEADTEISITGHEISETVSDPQGTAWYDSAGFESGDECAYIYGDSTSFGGVSPAKHNQVINGHPYFIQEEPSIRAFSVAPQWACEQHDQALVSSISPNNNAADVSSNTVVVAVFDIAMNKPATQAAFTLKRTSDGSSVTGTFSWYGNALIFKPNADLGRGLQYTAHITTGAQGSLGDPLPAAKTWTFTVTTHVWTIVPSPNPNGAAYSYLYGVSCANATTCFAVGYFNNGGGDITLVERWNGTSWSIVPSPNTSTQNGRLLGVSCTSSTNCFAVGYYITSSGDTLTLVERWNGTSWSIVSSPNPTGATYSLLNGVSCTSSTSCFAAGGWETGDGDGTLVERWNGTSWSIVSSPNPTGASYSHLLSVSCTSATSCFAVGDDLRSGAYVTLVERWNGTSWSLVPSPNPAATYPPGEASLEGVSCTSATNCFAVGIGGDCCTALVEHWNGSNWAITSSPKPSGSFLRGVSCTSNTSCFAVGGSSTSSQNSVPLVDRWNGTSWSIVSSPNPTGATLVELLGVSCTSATSCFAVGDSATNYSNSVPLIERWS